jgi:aminoglycoside phosphotransferase (APT) family kinase protein
VSKADITVELVSQLVADQFPRWAHLAVRPVEVDGWDNATFRLGDTMSVRVPSGDDYALQVDKEQRWLPVLAPQLPLPIPVPLGRGRPSTALPRPWSVYGWIDGEPLLGDRIVDTVALADDLAGFLGALYACRPAGPAPGAHSFQRGGPVTVWTDHVEANLQALRDHVDAGAAREVWSAALAARQEMPPVWVHGDITGTNLLARDGRLAAVLDFGCSAYGDPACDLTIAWTFLTGAARHRFMAGVPVEPSAWARARGWALWKALNHLIHDQTEPGRGRRADHRMGWRITAHDVIDEVVADHHQT